MSQTGQQHSKADVGGQRPSSDKDAKGKQSPASSASSGGGAGQKSAPKDAPSTK